MIAREAEFEKVAVAWLNKRFPGAVLQARADRDEFTFHVHAIVMVTTEKVSARRVKQMTIQPSANGYTKDYRLLQDDAGKAFTAVGLKRGKRTARARWEMAKRGKELLPKARHVHPREHQKAEDLRLMVERSRPDADKAALACKTEAVEERDAGMGEQEAAADSREAEADAILAVAEGVATDEIEPPREGESASGLRISKKERDPPADPEGSESGKAGPGGFRSRIRTDARKHRDRRDRTLGGAQRGT